MSKPTEIELYRVIKTLLEICKICLRVLHDNYDGPNGWVGIGRVLGPILEGAIEEAEKCLNG